MQGNHDHRIDGEIIFDNRDDKDLGQYSYRALIGISQSPEEDLNELIVQISVAAGHSRNYDSFSAFRSSIGGLESFAFEILDYCNRVKNDDI